MSNKKEDILTAIEFLKSLSEIDKDFAMNEAFKHSNKEECLKTIENIEKINEKIKLEKNKSKKGNLTLTKGKELEKLASQILGVGNLYNIYSNIKCDSNEIDLLLSLASTGQSLSMFLPTELKEDIIVECKNYNKKIDVTWTGKLYSLIKYKNVKTAILFSYLPLKGRNNWDSAKGLVKKLYLKDDVLIINITVDDVKKILLEDYDPIKEKEYNNIISLIRSKIKDIKYHTDFSKFIQNHPAECLD